MWQLVNFKNYQERDKRANELRYRLTHEKISNKWKAEAIIDDEYLVNRFKEILILLLIDFDDDKIKKLWRDLLLAKTKIPSLSLLELIILRIEIIEKIIFTSTEELITSNKRRFQLTALLHGIWGDDYEAVLKWETILKEAFWEKSENIDEILNAFRLNFNVEYPDNETLLIIDNLILSDAIANIFLNSWESINKENALTIYNILINEYRNLLYLYAQGSFPRYLIERINRVIWITKEIIKKIKTSKHITKEQKKYSKFTDFLEIFKLANFTYEEYLELKREWDLI